MLTPTAIDLIKEMEQMQVIDCHEHLSSEKDRLNAKVDVFTLFSHYTAADIAAAGLSGEDHAKLFNHNIDLDERWAIFKPILPQIRYGSYARPAFIAAKELFGCDDINDDTYRVLSERIAQNNTPGIYRRLLRERCKIRVCLNQGGTTAEDGDQFVNLSWVDGFTNLNSHQQYAGLCTRYKKRPRSLDGYVDMVRVALEQTKADGVGGLKIPRTWPWPSPSRKEATRVLKRLLDKKKITPDDNLALEGYLVGEVLDIARDLDLTVAVHAGVWGDFPRIDAKNFIPWIMAHPETRIDLYHLSIPSVRDCIVIGKNFPNVWLNLCWTHIISQKLTQSAIDEILDMLPVNKVLGFGGDYGLPVEKVLGHLMMAREDIAIVLGRRIDDGMMNRDEALTIIRKWLWDNPKALYKLEV